MFVALLKVTSAVLAGKALLAGFAIIVARYPLRVAIIAGLAVAQIGEFSFILLKEGLKLGVIAPDLHQMLLTSAVMTMALAPLIIVVSPSLAYGATRLNFVAGLFPQGRLGDLEEKASTLSNHVIICGYGVAGQNMAKLLKQNSIPYIVLELNSQTVREARRQSESIAYGDATGQTAPAFPSSLSHCHSLRVKIIGLTDVWRRSAPAPGR